MTESKANLQITHARENNLKNISLEIEHDALTVVTGLSGSGKSSLAFQTVYAEGQRRYIETFSPYTRQFLDRVKHPDVDLVEHVRPAIALQQRTRVRNSRSTVGSMTNINDYLKVLWCNLATAVCPKCDLAFEHWEAADVATLLVNAGKKDEARTFFVCAPIVLSSSKSPKVSKSALRIQRERLLSLGFMRYLNPRELSVGLLEESLPVPDATGKIFVVLERVRGVNIRKKSLQESVREAFRIGNKTCLIVETSQDDKSVIPDSRIREFREGYIFHTFSTLHRCPSCEMTVSAPRPSLFSFNHPLGACPECNGFGRILAIDPALIVPDSRLSLKGGAISCWEREAGEGPKKRLLDFCKKEKIPTTKPWRELSESQRQIVLNGDGRKFPGVTGWFKRLEKKAYKMHVRVFLSRYRSGFECSACLGTRLKSEALAFRVEDRKLPEIWNMPVGALLKWLTSLLKFAEQKKSLTRQIHDVLQSAISRVRYLDELGLSYLTLERAGRTLSGGETQRVNLAAALGSGLTHTQFVLDEPTVGLHSRDTERLMKSLRELTDNGNSLLVVEHDLDSIDCADNIIEIGPGTGEEGGSIVYSGTRANWAGIMLDPIPQSLAF
ncbi:MAG: hypothetical protein KDD53_04250, partial [Bdellovibrionales bacterium]|nr:hypothetical protein [Bdellovibrionales bacterium]